MSSQTIPSPPDSEPEPTTFRSESDRARARGRRWWLWLATAVLVVAAATAGLVVGRATAPDPPAPEPIAGLASTAITSALQQRITALNSGDVPAMTALYSDDAVLWEGDQNPPVVTTGARDIAEHLAEYAGVGFRVFSESPAIQYGPYVAEAATWSGGQGVLVYRFDDAGLITEQWVVGAAS